MCNIIFINENTGKSLEIPQILALQAPDPDVREQVLDLAFDDLFDRSVGTPEILVSNQVFNYVARHGGK